MLLKIPVKVRTKVFFVIVQITVVETASLPYSDGAADAGKPLRELDADRLRTQAAIIRIITDEIVERSCFQPEHFQDCAKML